MRNDERSHFHRPDMAARFGSRFLWCLRSLLLSLLSIGGCLSLRAVPLELPAEAATAFALVTAANILVVCTFLAVRRADRASVLETILVALYPVLIGVALAETGFFSQEEDVAAEAEEPGGQT